MDGYLQLAAAIVERAVIDYKTALKTYICTFSRNYERMKNHV